MTQMTEDDLLSIVKSAKESALTYNSEFQSENEEALNRYMGNPYGDEVEERSHAMSMDVSDVVEADMPSLARIFLGSGDVVTFEPNTSDDVEIEEAEQKTKYINWLVRRQPDSFKLIHDWIKDAEIQKMGVVKYFVEDATKVREHEFTLTEDQIASAYKNLEDEGVEVEAVSQSEPDEFGYFDLVLRTTHKQKKTRIVNVPTENFIISKNAACKNSAAIVGDVLVKTRGELLADGYSKKLVKGLNTIGSNVTSSTLKNIRFEDEGGDDYNAQDYAGWANEKVELADLYVRVDFDGDGIAERRHILLSGDEILENESFDHVPYAMMSAILMPHRAIGRSRAEITMPTQRIKTVLLRQTLDNVYMVNNGRNIVSGAVNLDDLLTVRPNGVVRLNDKTTRPADAVFPLQTEFVGDKSLAIIQYMDQARAQTTGSLMASQGLDADALSKETATRFTGIEDKSAAKVELVARAMAETGFRQLYEGLAWLVSEYQDEETEFRVLGKPLIANPKSWKHEHSVVSSVGLGAGTNDQTISNKTAIYQIQSQLKQAGSPLVDDKKLYNVISDIMESLDMPKVYEAFNDPEQPDELILAESEQLKGMVQQLQQEVERLQNPLAEAEEIKAQAGLIKAQGELELKIKEFEAKQKQFAIETEQKRAEEERKAIEFQQDFSARLTEIEAKYAKDVPGALI